MNAYSKDLRLKVIDAVKRGIPRREVSELLGISLWTISRYMKLKACGRQIAPKPSPGRNKAKILDSLAHKGALWRQLEGNDTATLEEHCEMFEKEQRVCVCVSTMSRAVRKLGWTFKKDRWHPPKETSKEEALSERT
jgi:transposase